MALIDMAEEQKDSDLRPSSYKTFISPNTNNELTLAEREVLGQAISTSGMVMAHRQASHVARSEENPITNALSSLLYSFAYSVAGAVIAGGLLLLALNFIGGEEGFYFIVWLIAWGACFLAALAYNRWQGLWFSPAGLEHHEIDSRERIAIYVIDRHLTLLERKWQIKD